MLTDATRGIHESCSRFPDDIQSVPRSRSIASPLAEHHSSSPWSRNIAIVTGGAGQETTVRAPPITETAHITVPTF